MKRVGMFLIAIMAFGVLSAVADDFAPPEWRGDPLSYHAEWEFNGPLPDILFPDFESDGGPKAGEILDPGPTQILPGGWIQVPADGDGGITGETQLIIDVRNWIDFEEYKDIRLQLTYDGPAPTFRVAEGFKGGIPSGDTAVATTMDIDPRHRYMDFRLYPNPDWETIVIDITPETVIDEIVLDTISIPEPSVIVMVLAAGGGLVFIRRKFMI